MQLASIPATVIPNQADGTLLLQHIQNSIKGNSDFHACQTKLLCLENTAMLAGGIPLTPEYLHQVGQLTRNHNVAVHVDGARIYNAAVSLDCNVSDLLSDVDSVSMCLSKGLGCPVGSVIGGTRDFIWQAQRIRKSLGGGMRQSGFLASAGLFALEQARDVLSRDHTNARRLAEGIKDLGCPNVLDVDVERVRSNLLYTKCRPGTASHIVGELRAHGVLCLPFNDQTIRFVTHLDVSEDDIDNALLSIGKVVKQFPTQSS